MAKLSDISIKALRSQLHSASVLTPDSDGYQASLTRWSDTGMKPAVMSKRAWHKTQQTD
jgi:hypothetical protein